MNVPLKVGGTARSAIGVLAVMAFLFFITTVVHADNLNSDNYKIHMGTINMGSGNATSSSYGVTNTMGQTANGQFNSTGYVVRSGFQYIYTTFTPFRFIISKLNIDFANLIPGAAQTDSNTLAVQTGSAYGYTVTAIEDHPLQLGTLTTTIPDTTCDSGCTINSAGPWTLTSAYGFGYNAAGIDVNTADFVNNTYFKPFPNLALSQSPVVVATRPHVATQSAVSTITYRLNISSTQPAGQYANAIQFTAIPAY